ncbi:MAG: DUF4294 domain-containing protein [Crocinitomicaceae bacterium]|nr:DUF4294 domain-containing protein [Crocinitomicaceae bacterium]
MLRFIISCFSFTLLFGSKAQEDTTIVKEKDFEVMHVDKNFGRKYKSQLHQLKAVYPLALKAKQLIDDYEKDLEDLKKNRKKKKYSKEAHQHLKDEFTYNIRDLYQSEGDLLMKLIHRETGMTVHQIIKKYRGSFQSTMYNSMGKLWGHNLKDTYDAKGEDWITEVVIQDIESGRISFEKEMKKLDKNEYKDSMKSYRQNKKNGRKARRNNKKNNRKTKKKD